MLNTVVLSDVVLSFDFNDIWSSVYTCIAQKTYNNEYGTMWSVLPLTVNALHRILYDNPRPDHDFNIIMTEVMSLLSSLENNINIMDSDIMSLLFPNNYSKKPLRILPLELIDAYLRHWVQNNQHYRKEFTTHLMRYFYYLVNHNIYDYRYLKLLIKRMPNITNTCHLLREMEELRLIKSESYKIINDVMQIIDSIDN